MRRFILLVCLSCFAFMAWGQDSELIRKAESGDADQQYLLGLIYTIGDEKVHKNYSEATKWLIKAAEQGHMKALLQLGINYRNGMGCFPQNYEESVKWFLKAVEQGSVEALYELGDSYDIGRGCFPKNYEESAKWYLKAAEQGHAEAQKNIGRFYWLGNGVPEDRDKAESWLLKSAAQGYDGAYFSLGLFYENDNKDEAIYWFKKSMDAHYEKYGEESKSTAEKLQELGIDYHPGSKSSSITSTSSSSNSRSSSSSSSYSSSSSSSDDGLLYEGVYTRSSQGYCPQTGLYTDAIGPGFQLHIKIYDSYIIVIGTRCEYVRTSGGWKIYEGNTMFGGTEYYKVNPNNYEMSYYTYSSNPYTGGGITLVYEMKKGDAVFDIRQNNTNTYGSGYNSGSSSSGSNHNRSTSTSNQKICNLCHGTGTCETCAGKHRYLNPYTNKYVTCPNCGPDGRCRGCNGTGRR